MDHQELPIKAHIDSLKRHYNEQNKPSAENGMVNKLIDVRYSDETLRNLEKLYYTVDNEHAKSLLKAVRSDVYKALNTQFSEYAHLDKQTQSIILTNALKGLCEPKAIQTPELSALLHAAL